MAKLDENLMKKGMENKANEGLGLPLLYPTIQHRVLVSDYNRFGYSQPLTLPRYSLYSSP